jgi:hypothetical protein
VEVEHWYCNQTRREDELAALAGISVVDVQLDEEERLRAVDNHLASRGIVLVVTFPPSYPRERPHILLAKCSNEAVVTRLREKGLLTHDNEILFSRLFGWKSTYVCALAISWVRAIMALATDLLGPGAPAPAPAISDGTRSAPSMPANTQQPQPQ